MNRHKWKISVSMVILFLSLGFLLSPMTGIAAENSKRTSQELPETGFENRDGDGWTTLDEEHDFLNEVSSMSERVSYSQVGTSVEGRPIYMARMGFPKAPTDEEIEAGRSILIEGTPHGNEPAGREMVLKLMRDLAFSDDPETLDLLSNTTILFIPTPNPDGRYANQRTNVDGIDVNRDHLNLETPEGRTEEKIINKFHPEIIVDAHERPSAVGNPDVEVLWPTNLNVDEQLRELNMDMIQNYVQPDIEKADFTTGLYGKAPSSGSGSERILRNMTGLRHSLGILVETPGKADPKRRVQMHMSAAESVLRFYQERSDDVGEVVTEAPKRSTEAGANQDPFYLGGTYGWDQSKYPPTILDPAPCGYLITASQAEKIDTNIRLFSIKTEKVDENGVLVPMNQPMRTIVPLLLDEKADYNMVHGIPLFDCANPGTASSMKTLVKDLGDQDEITSAEVVRSLQVHLNTVDYFEQKNAADKVVKHMQGFKRLLDKQKESDSISERSFDTLDNYADYLIEKWQP